MAATHPPQSSNFLTTLPTSLLLPLPDLDPLDVVRRVQELCAKLQVGCRGLSVWWDESTGEAA